ncbi:hypothetical protein [Streptomyces griseomycini]|uniref:Uncharacterized protein n=1 Tax=Streptomyces griseomycini TaxID=66895 RepID=A0A7W7PYD2_9ACTN|nr:hypothetical protein [Streptomyces griseomycini]MBB4903565.1 hypothetical protein [Streptomyces griseomycini]GGR58476.1 hypothetical protein GCM10015536_73840 [Streptomyces griseomycini]
MSKKNRTSSATPSQSDLAPAPAPWWRLVSVALVTGAARHIGALLAGLAVTWRQHD